LRCKQDGIARLEAKERQVACNFLHIGDQLGVCHTSCSLDKGNLARHGLSMTYHRPKETTVGRINHS